MREIKSITIDHITKYVHIEFSNGDETYSTAYRFYSVIAPVLFGQGREVKLGNKIHFTEYIRK
jgi:hypothetical protein